MPARMPSLHTIASAIIFAVIYAVLTIASFACGPTDHAARTVAAPVPGVESPR